MKRVSTGAFGLDELLGGGVAEKSVTLVVGGTGTGKTVLCLQFVLEGALKGERSVFAGFNETPDELRETANSFGLRPGQLEKKGRLVLLDCASARAGTHPHGKGLKPVELVSARGAIARECASFKAKRLALDAFTPLAAGKDYRESFHRLARTLKGAGLTSFVSAEPDCAPVHEADNVIVLKRGDGGLFLEVLKVRGASHSTSKHPYAITEAGFCVRKADFVL